MISIRNVPNLRILIYAFIAIIIIVGSILYSNYLSVKLAELEEQRIQLYADAFQIDNNEGAYEAFVFKRIIQEHELIPTILADDSGRVVSFKNLGIPESHPDSLQWALPEIRFRDSLQKIGDQLSPKEKAMLDSLNRVEKEIKSFNSTKQARAQRILDGMISSGAEPLKIEFGTEDFKMTQHIYYDDSYILKQLKIYPYVQLVVIIIFISIIFIGFFIATRNEQNKVWVGLAKETAHQLGTPVSSLMAWMEYLKLKLGDNPSDKEIVEELEKDVERLQVITERFSKIGSKPELKEMPVSVLIDNVSEYIRKRMSKKVELEVDNQIPEDGMLHVNPPLFEWVIENLMKNALDAIANDGKISIHAEETPKEMIIEVRDTGKGIPKHLFKTVFKPGFTTKKRGWGLGLSLTKRIVENYHQGKIYVKQSEIGKGTTFRVILPKGKK